MTTARRLRLKTWPSYFRAVRADEKPFEVRWNDRDYQVGDILELAEFDPVTEAFTGQEEIRRATFVLADEQFGIMPGYVAIGLERIAPAVTFVGVLDLTAGQLMAWHMEQARNAKLRGDNYRFSADRDGRLPNTGVAVQRHLACAAAADLEAGFHAKAATLLQEAAGA